MTEYDAFGREKGEDTLAGLGSLSQSGGATPGPVIAEPERPAAATPVRPAPTATASGGRMPRADPWRRFRIARAVAVAVALVVVFAIGAAMLAVFSTGVETVKKVRPFVEGLTIPTVPSAPSPPAADESPAPGLRGSLLRPRAFAAALTRLERARPSGPARFLRVAPDRVSAQLRASSGRLVIVTVTARSTQTVPTGASAGGATIPLRRIDRRAPSRIERAMRRRGRRVDYLVLSPLVGSPRWLAYARGQLFSADVHGRRLVRGAVPTG